MAAAICSLLTPLLVLRRFTSSMCNDLHPLICPLSDSALRRSSFNCACAAAPDASWEHAPLDDKSSYRPAAAASEAPSVSRAASHGSDMVRGPVRARSLHTRVRGPTSDAKPYRARTVTESSTNDQYGDGKSYNRNSYTVLSI